MSPVIKISNRLSRASSKPARMVAIEGWHTHSSAYAWVPPTDFYETEGGYVVRVEVAGMNLEDFKISLERNYLIISGVREDSAERRAYHQMEIRFGEFRTVIALPAPVDANQAEAVYRDGFLSIRLPKAQPSKIEVNKKD